MPQYLLQDNGSYFFEMDRRIRKQDNRCIELCGYRLGEDYFFAPKEIRYQDAPSAGLLALEKIKQGELLTDPEQCLPEYMRKAEAQQKLEAGQLSLAVLRRYEGLDRYAGRRHCRNAAIYPESQEIGSP